MRPKIKITLEIRSVTMYVTMVMKLGRNWHFDKDRGGIFSLAMHTLFLMVDILRYCWDV